ncbi:MAG: preprotein translocase subunit SecY [Anaerolineales bacterium]|nr:preprotein translocase subunit SecY [Anaerolineales bacterium]
MSMLRKAVNFLRHLWAAEDLRNRVLISLMLLVIYRVASHVPVPGVNLEALRALLQTEGSTFLNMLDMIAGGTIANFSVMAMGPYPYITAQIILQLLSPIIPGMEQRQKEDPQGARRWMERWTYYIAVPMAALQSLSQIGIVNAINTPNAEPILPNFGWNLPSVAVIVTMTAGTMFAIWLGELISEYGLRNQGLSLIIFAGIVSRIPNNLAAMAKGGMVGLTSLAVYILVIVAVIFLIIIVQQGRRNIPVMYPGRRIGFRQAMPVRANLPLMVNMAGMIPLIFAGTFISMPNVFAGWIVGAVPDNSHWLHNAALSVMQFMNGNTAGYYIIFFLLVVGFTFFYTDVQFTQANFAENLRRSGAQIPGVTSGEATQKYLTRVMRRITFPGAFFLGLVAILPFLVGLIVDLGSQRSQLLITSSGLLIVVGVVRELYFTLEAELKLRGYDESLLVK